MVRLNATSTALTSSTFLRGSGVDEGTGIAVDNPQTQFTLMVREEHAVRVERYDVLGRRVAGLPGEVVAEGSARQVAIDGSALASGVYLVHIAGEGFHQARRVMLLK